LNGAVALILLYFTKFGSFEVVEDRSKMSAEYLLPLLAKKWSSQQFARSLCDS